MNLRSKWHHTTINAKSPARPFVAGSLLAYLIQDDNGRPLPLHAMRGRFDKARKAAGVDFQFRDIRAKTASDTGGLAHSQRLLWHKNSEVTEHCVRQRNRAAGQATAVAFDSGVTLQQR